MSKVVAVFKAGLILMHMRGTPENMQRNLIYDNLLEEIKFFLDISIKKAVTAGISKSSIIIDPGLGFGKSVFHNLEIINCLDTFSSFNLPVMVGPSRKTFIQKILGTSFNVVNTSPMSSNVETGTQATVAAAVMRGAKIVRVHNVANTRATLDIIDALKVA